MSSEAPERITVESDGVDPYVFLDPVARFGPTEYVRANLITADRYELQSQVMSLGAEVERLERELERVVSLLNAGIADADKCVAEDRRRIEEGLEKLDFDGLGDKQAVYLGSVRRLVRGEEKP